MRLWNDKEILSQVYLEEYAQELAVKGNLKIILKGKEISPGGLLLWNGAQHENAPPCGSSGRSEYQKDHNCRK